MNFSNNGSFTSGFSLASVVPVDGAPNRTRRSTGYQRHRHCLSPLQIKHCVILMKRLRVCLNLIFTLTSSRHGSPQTRSPLPRTCLSPFLVCLGAPPTGCAMSTSQPLPVGAVID